MQLFYAESPTQLLNMEDIFNKFEGKNLFLVRFNGSEANDRQIKAIIKGFKLLNKNKVSFKYIHLNKSYSIFSLARVWSTFKLLTLLFAFFPFSSLVVLGDMRTFIYKVVSYLSFGKKNILLVDDGLYLYPYLKNTPINKKNVHFYSNLPISEFVSNKVIKSGRSKVQTMENNVCVFIGSKLVEFGLCDIDKHQNYLFGTLEFIRSEHSAICKFIYIPHREESPKNIVLYRELGFEIKYLNLPIELYEKENGCIGSVYCTFYSSALYNLAQSNTNSYYSIKPLYKNFWNKNKDNISVVYDLFEQIDTIKVVEL